MKKLFFISLICVLANSARALTYYFSSVSGDDSRTAAEAQNQETPWKTLSKLNSFFPSLQPGDIVLFKRGEVFDGSIIVGASGTLSSPIVLSSYGTGSKPVINGFTGLSNWVSVGNGIFESYNPALGSSLNMVLVNGVQQAMGRYPNADAANRGYLTFESHTNNTAITDNQLTAAVNWTGAQLVVRTNRFTFDRVLITNHSGGTLTYSPALTYTPSNNFGYFIQNDIRTLDQFGEWYYNPATKKVSMYFGAASPLSYTVKASAVDTLFNMFNLDNVVVDGLAFEGANKRGMNFYSVDIGVSKVLNCDIRFCGDNGIFAGTSKNIVIDGNTITDANDMGIYCSVSGPGNYTVTNNTLKRISVPMGMSAGGGNLNLGIKVNADNSVIENNVLDSIGNSGIRFTGDQVIVRKNVIQHYCLNLDDGGGIYANAPSGASTGRKIISNIIMNGGAPLEGQTSLAGATNGIYLDDNVTGIIVDSNTVINNNLNGIYLHNCVSISVRNNLVYNSTVSQFRLVHNTPQSNFRNLIINNNQFVAKTADQFTFYAQTDASDTDFSLWGAIDNNYHARPLLQSTVIKAVKPSYNQALSIADWSLLSTFDQHSYTSPKTFPGSTNPDDSIRFEFNASPVAKTVSLNKEYIDIKSNRYTGSVVLQPFTSLILMPPPVTPTINITYPLNNTSFASPATLTVVANAGASGLVNKVDFYNGTTLLGSDNTSPYEFTWTAMPSGSYSLSAKVTDDVSQTSTSSVVSIVVNDPPLVSLTSPLNNAGFAAPASVTINATASDPDGTISKVEFYNGNTLLGTDNTSPYTFTWTNVAAGNYLITAKATDNGSLTTTSAAITISVNAAPRISITAPLNSTVVAGPADVTINATADDDDGTVSKVDFYNGTTLLGTDFTSPFSFTWNNVPVGNYSITAKATDNGSLSTTSAAISFAVNAAPSISLTAPANNASFASPANVTVNALAGDADGTVSKVDFYNGSTLLGTDYTSPFSFIWSDVPTGNYSLTATATDNTLLATTSLPVVISVYTPNVAPAVSVSVPGAAFAAPASITINASADDADGSINKVEFYNGTTLLKTVFARPFTFTWDNVSAGNYSIIAKATDNGSLEASSEAVNISVHSLPTVNITSPGNNTVFAAPADVTFTAVANDNDNGAITKVEFYNGTSLLGTDYTSPFSFTWANVPKGNYSVTAKATSSASLEGASAAVNITVNQPPAVSITSPLANSTYPAPGTIAISANADADGAISRVDFYSGATLLGSDNTSPYTFTWNNVAAGSYTLTAKAVDGAALETTSAAIPVSVNAAPTVSITSPGNNATYAAHSPVTISAIAGDDETVSKVEFYNGAVLLGTDNTSPYSFTWTDVPAGNYSLTARATDNGSLQTTSATVNIIVHEPPSVYITTPVNNATFAAPATVMITADAADDGSISKVEFYNGATLLGVDNTSPYTFTWNNLPQGSYSITAKATDDGSLVTTSDAVDFSVYTPNVPPIVNITTPANNASFPAPAGITINANALDDDGSISRVEFYNGATLLGSDNTSPYSFTWANVPKGRYSITVKAIDNGSLETVSSAVDILVNEPPTITITTPLANTTFAAPANISIIATADDADGTVSRVDFYSGSTLIGSDNSSPFTFTWANVPEGNYSITAKATDDGSLVTTSAAIAISVYTPNIAPTVSISGPANNSIYAAPASVIITATTADADGSISKVDFYNGTTLLGTDNTSPYSFTWTNVPSGSYSITAVTTDNNSLSTTSSAVVIFVNAPPTVTVTAPSNNESFSAPANISINATAADADGSVAKVEFYNGTTLLGSDNTSPYSFTWTNVPAGNYSITAKATDDGSLITTSAAVGILVNAAPLVSITSPSNNASFATASNVTFSAAASDADGTIVKVDFYNGSTLLGTDNTSPYTFTWVNPPAGNYFITAKATDNGSSVTTSAAVAISVSSAPTVSITAPVNNTSYASPANIIINAVAADNDGTISKVEFYNGATLLGTDNTSPYSFTWANAAAGSYSITAKATDNSTLMTTSAPVAVTVSAAPAVNITAPANNAIFTAPATITISAAATDADGTISKVDFYNGATLIGTDNTSPYSFTWTSVASGSYSITAKATDNSTLVTASAPVAVTVSAAPAVNITAPANNAIFTAPATITISAAATDADGTISKVDFYNGATLLGTDNTSPYSFTWANVAAGNYSITAVATDNSNSSTTSSAIALSVNAAPTVNITSPVNNAAFAAPGTITINATAADVDGTVNKVDFYNGTTLIGTDNTSPYSFTWINVAAGSYSITAVATDNSNSTTTSSAIAVSVNSAPTVNITGPANNAIFAAPAAITISAAATDADGTISKVDFYNGATLLGTDNSSPYSFTWTNVAAGSYSITAVATDNSSSTTTSSAIAVSVNSAPTVNITGPANNAIFAAPAAITISAAATDADGTISKVDFYNGATLLGTDNSSPYSFTWTNVAAGSYSVTAVATDNSNSTTTSSAIAISVNSAPTVSITSPANSATFAAPASITITATAADADGTITKVDFYNGSTLLGSDNTSPYSFTWANVTAGNYSFTAVATDNNASVTTSAAIAVSVTSAPSVSITSPANGATFAAPASITITATAADADGTVSKVDFYSGSTLIGTDIISPYSFTWTNIAAGNYSLTAKATDNSALVTTSAAVAVSVSSAPTVSITSPANNAAFASPASITINATAADADGTVSKVDFYNGATLIGTDNTSPYSFTWTNVTAGNYSITAKATDNSALATTSAAVAVSVSSAPTVSITSPANNATFAAPASITINATAADADGTVSKVDFYNGATLIGTDNTSPYTFTWTNVAAGSYSITAKATDNFGLATTSAAVAVSVNSAPTVSITSPSNNAAFVPLSTITINATAADAGGSITKVDFYNGSTLLGTDNTSPYSFTWTSVATGSYSITARATDNSALVTTSAAVAISVNPAPTVSITSPAANAVFASLSTITITATAADAGGSVSKVDFYNGTTLLGTDNTSPYSFTWTNVAAGSYSITAKATDNSALVTTSAAVAISVNAAPIVNITSPANNAAFAPASTITIMAAASDAGGSISKVDFYNGATLLGSDNTAPYTFIWTNVAAGSYSLTAKATDNSSLVTTSSAVSIVVNSAPTVSITSPANNASFNSPASITITASAADAGGSISKVEFYNGATLLGTDVTSPYSFTWSGVTSGSYTLTAKATDNSSLSTTSSARTITVTGPPTVSITSPVSNATFTPPASIVINATAADPGGSVSKVDFYNGSTLLGTDNTSPYSFTWNNVAAGSYSIRARATDNSALTTFSATVAVTVNAAPSVSVTAPANNANFSASSNIVINATASDAGGSVSKVEFYNGSTLLGTDNTSPYSFTWTNVPAGTYSVTAKATDNSGLTKVSSTVIIRVTQSITLLRNAGDTLSLFTYR